MTNTSDRLSRRERELSLEELEQELRRWNYLLGEDRPLATLLQDDAAEVLRLGLDLREVTAKMERLYREGRRGLGAPVLVDDSFQVTVREDRGIIPCLWRDHFASPKAIIEAVNLKNGKTLTFSVLGWHLISAHGFFQGKGSPFRMEPRVLFEFFEGT
ncbi:MAG: hypothetical protein ACOYXY_01840 [Thermodesulfobacteriota bacterium]